MKIMNEKKAKQLRRACKGIGDGWKGVYKQLKKLSKKCR